MSRMINIFDMAYRIINTLKGGGLFLTGVCHKANINSFRFHLYIPIFIRAGLMKKRDGLYMITEKGFDYIREYEKFRERWELLESDGDKDE